jgi:hypothetical protein
MAARCSAKAKTSGARCRRQAVSGGTVCVVRGGAAEQIGRVRCSARSKSSGEQCQRPAIPAGTVCVMHGGAAPQVAAAARRRLLDAFARRSLWEIGVWPQPDPEVLALAGQLDRLRRKAPAWWRRVDEAA